MTSNTNDNTLAPLRVADLTQADIDLLALPLGALAPAGEDLEYGADFLQLQQDAKSRPEVQYGSNLTPEQTPDWLAVAATALQLARRTRDLRVAMLLTRGLLEVRGVEGLALGLALLVALLADHWPHLYPQLDADDGNDPMLRINILATLCEPATVLRALRAAPLVQARGYGKLSLRDIDLASGELDAAPDPGRPTLSIIDAAFRDADAAALAATDAALAHACRSGERIEQLLQDRVGVAQALDMAPLTLMLRRAGAFTGRYVAPAGAAADGAGAEAGAGVGAGAGVAAAAPAAPRGAIAGRDDITRVLDELCAYYAEHEPGSPIPLLLQRARRLVHKSFIELLHDLAPDGLGQFAQVSGLRGDG